MNLVVHNVALEPGKEMPTVADRVKNAIAGFDQAGADALSGILQPVGTTSAHRSAEDVVRVVGGNGEVVQAEQRNGSWGQVAVALGFRVEKLPINAQGI